MTIFKSTPAELQALDSPPTDILAWIDHLFPRALTWFKTVEAEYCGQGRALSLDEIKEAYRLGVAKPEAVRVVILEAFPMPTDRELRAEAQRFGYGGPKEGGRTVGYVIMLKPQVAHNPTVLAHELVHVSQVDRLGREGLLRRYLIEMAVVGYACSPLELEAYEKQGGMHRSSLKTESICFSDSNITPDTIHAYLETEYVVLGDHSFTLRVGQASKDLHTANTRHGSDCCAFLTAFNPFSRAVDESENARRQHALGVELKRRCLKFADGIGSHPHNSWPGEPSYLVFGLTLDASKVLGHQFEQNAIIWCGADCIPRLILLR